MNPDYTKLAYERTVVAELRRHLMDVYLHVDGHIKPALICDDLPFASREVPNEIIVNFILNLEEEEKALLDELSKFDFRKKDVRQVNLTDTTRKRKQNTRRKTGKSRTSPDGDG